MLNLNLVFFSGTILNDGASWHIQRRFILKNLKDLGFGKRSSEAIIQEEARVSYCNISTQESLYRFLYFIQVYSSIYTNIVSQHSADRLNSKYTQYL